MPRKLATRKKIVKILHNGNLIEVRIMAEAEGHAMVRRPGCYPFVINIKNILHD